MVAASATVIGASLEAPGVLPQALHACTAADVVNRCVTISIAVPLSVTSGASVCIRQGSVSGHFLYLAQPLMIPIRRGIQAPLQLYQRMIFGNECSSEGMFISTSGQIFCVKCFDPFVVVYDDDGGSLPELVTPDLGATVLTRRIAFAGGDPQCLLLARSGAVRLDPAMWVTAVDMLSNTVRWDVRLDRFAMSCDGLAALPSQAIAILASNTNVFALRLSDGETVISFHIPRLGKNVAADDASGAIFANVTQSVLIPGHYAVCRLSWIERSLMVEGIVAAAGELAACALLAVVPPAPGKRVSHLVIVTTGTSALLVLALPSLALVHTHTLEGMVVMGLAADPCGEALAVCDKVSSSIHVLVWPLPGMLVLG